MADDGLGRFVFVLEVIDAKRERDVPAALKMLVEIGCKTAEAAIREVAVARGFQVNSMIVLRQRGHDMPVVNISGELGPERKDG